MFRPVPCPSFNCRWDEADGADWWIWKLPGGKIEQQMADYLLVVDMQSDYVVRKHIMKN